MSIVTNAQAIAAKYAKRAVGLDTGEARGIKRWAVTVNRKQIKNLDASNLAPPGTFPVPNRSGTLMRGADERHFSRYAVVVNTTEYSAAIHSGELTTRDGRKYAVRPRPFLQLAADSVNGLAMIADEIQKQWAI